METESTTMKSAHFVFAKKSQSLRNLENDLTDSIASALEGWEITRAIGSPQRGSVNVTFFVFRRAHIMMSHGVADKNYLLRREGSGALGINKFTDVCVPGDWMKRKLLALPEVSLPPERIHVVGWPRLDSLLQQQTERQPSDKLRVLWAPTHDKAKAGATTVSSYPGMLEHLPLLQQEFDVEVSLHPANRSGGRPTFEQLLDADVVVSDSGTIVYEAWALGKQVIFPDWLVREQVLRSFPGSAEAEIYTRNIGLHARSIDELMDLLGSPPPMDQIQQEFLEEYLPRETFGRSCALFAEVVEEVWQRGRLKVNKRRRS